MRESSELRVIKVKEVKEGGRGGRRKGEGDAGGVRSFNAKEIRISRSARHLRALIPLGRAVANHVPFQFPSSSCQRR